MLKSKPFLCAAIGAITMFFAFSLSSSPVYAVESTITVSISDSSLVLDLLPKKANGDFVTSNDISIGINLTGSGGYTLGIRANSTGDDATRLINTTDNTKYFTSITSAVSASSFAEDTAAAAANYNNKWGYLPSNYNSVRNYDYQPAPSEDVDILSNSTYSSYGNFTISIGARANLDTAVGSYNNTFVIVAVANYSCNPGATNINEVRCMQDFNGDNHDAIIDSMVMNKQYRLYDNRDWNQYYVAKMKDGRVWMTQNLYLTLETSPDIVSALTSENTDLNVFGSDNYDTNNGYACSNETTTTNCTADGEIISWTPVSSTLPSYYSSKWSNNNNTPYSISYGGNYYYSESSGSTSSYSTLAACNSAHNDGTCPHYHVGIYYNFTAAVASNSTSGITSNYKTMGNSICPAGWRLPQGSVTNDATAQGYYSEPNLTLVAQNVMSKYYLPGETMLYEGALYKYDPFYFTVAGYETGGSVILASIFYWTNTVYSASNSYSFLGNNISKTRGEGHTVRCISVPSSNSGHTTITFDKNADDATGTTGNNNTQTINADLVATLVANGFSRSGYMFNSWNTEPDGTGTTYVEGAKYYAITGTATTNVTLYAQWDKGYTVTFKTADANTTGIYFDGTKYTNNQTAMAYEGYTYNIGGDFTTKHGFSSWTITAGSLANSSYPSTTFTMPSSNVTITLTSQEATTDISSLQNSSTPVSSNCKNEAITPILVYDPRDNEAYYVARLCDGNYWMLDNLRLDLTNSTVINNLSTSNTNASAEALGYLKNGGGSTTDKWPTAGLSGSNWTTYSSYSAPLVHTSGTVTAGSNQNTWTGSYTKDTIPPVTYGPGSGKMGVYYNYCAASAGTYCWGNDTNSTNSPTTDPNTTISPTARDIGGDICPAGWRMPTGGTYNAATGGGDYQNLYNQYSGGGTLGGPTTLSQKLAFENALSLPFSGIFNGAMGKQGSSALLLSSTWANSNGTYYLQVYEGQYQYFTDSTNRASGYSLRCVLYDPISVTVNFANGVESVTLKKENGPAQTVTTSGSTITLERNKSYTFSANYTTKYAFASWSATSGTPTSSTQHNITYIPSGNATITVTGQEATTDITTLVASTDPVSSNCKNEAITPILVYDPRDNEAYYVARLCDGKYWMLDNLRLDLSKALPSYSGTDKITLSTSNTNASEQAISCLLTGSYGGNACADSFSTAAVQTKTLSDGSWTNSYNLPFIATSGTCANASYCTHDPSTNQWTANSLSPITYGLGSGKIGIYYNYCAASAGSYCYASNTQTTDPNITTSPTARDIESDICPAGWHIPTGGSYNATTGGGDYQNLYNKYNEASVGQAVAFKTALSAPLSGYFYNSSSYYQGYYGGFWSSTWYNTNNMYYLYTPSGSVSPANTITRNYGRSVRCVLGS